MAKRFKQVQLNELNVDWSRSYKNKLLPTSYISYSMAEGERIYDALIQYYQKSEEKIGSVMISDLPVDKKIKMKYGRSRNKSSIFTNCSDLNLVI